MSVKTLRTSRAPLYAQVADTLKQRIERGRWKAGDLLPTLDELASEFEVAKITVRQAVKILQDEGFVASSRGRGTTVLARETTARPLNVETSLASLVDMYRGDKPDLNNLEECETALPEDVKFGVPFENYQMIRRTHSREGDTYCLITLYFAAHIFARHEARLRKEIALPVLFDDKKLNIKVARQAMTISKCDIETAGWLNLPIGEPMANVRRILCDENGKIIYMADVVYRGDFIRLEMDLMSGEAPT